MCATSSSLTREQRGMFSRPPHPVEYHYKMPTVDSEHFLRLFGSAQLGICRSHITKFPIATCARPIESVAYPLHCLERFQLDLGQLALCFTPPHDRLKRYVRTCATVQPVRYANLYMAPSERSRHAHTRTANATTQRRLEAFASWEFCTPT